MRSSSRRLSFLLLAAVAQAGVGCSNKALVDHSVDVSGETSDPASALAYEHSVSVSVAKSEVNRRMQEVRAACKESRFGPCELLQFEQRQAEWPSGTLVLRVVPDGVEPLVEQAAISGKVGSRSTVAHDLARDVADSARQEQRLQARRAELLAFRERKDLAVADMLALANEIATVETSLAELEQQGAAHERRINTNLLTLQWNSHGSESAWAAVGDAITDAGDTAIDGLAEAISYAVMLIPALILAFPIALLWRALWRRAVRQR